ncbi:MAG: hypothetical protein ACE5LU_30180 [Anaerolineae bacterium]
MASQTRYLGSYAMGNCNAKIGICDPYLPFRQVLGTLTGEVEGRLAQGFITQENAGRPRQLTSFSVPRQKCK